MDDIQKVIRSTGILPAKTLDALALIPEEEIWLAGQNSSQTRRAYRNDVQDFILSLGIDSTDDFRKVDRMAIIAWKRLLEKREVKPRTIRRKLAALSSLFGHLVDQRAVDYNPVQDISRPRVNRAQGMTAAFSPEEARIIMDLPAKDTVQGLRDRAILSVGFQVGARRSEIVGLKVRDFHRNMGYPALHFIRKGGQDHSLSIHPQTVLRIEEYLTTAGHKNDVDGYLFRPVKLSGINPNKDRGLSPIMVDRIIKKYAKQIGIERGFSAHSMRATFITRALENGAPLEEVQRAAGHADASTTKLYDKRGYNPEKSASFFANY